MVDDRQRALTVHEVAQILNVTEKTIYRLAQRGDMPGFKVAGAWRFLLSDILIWIEHQKQGHSKIAAPQSSRTN